MIESVENVVQIAALAVSLGIALFYAFTRRKKAWILLAFGYGSFLLGDLYWQVCLIFYGDTPQIQLVSELSWFASYIFLYLLLREVSPPDDIQERSRIAFLGPVFSIVMGLFYMQWGQYFSNIVTAALMGLLLYASIQRLRPGAAGSKHRFLAGVTLAFCLAEYLVWTASCFWDSETILNPYYWGDLILTIVLVLFLPSTKRAVSA